MPAFDTRSMHEGNEMTTTGTDSPFEILAEFDVLIEGPAWDGSGVLCTEIRNNRIQRFDPATGTCSVYRQNTGGANGLIFDAEGRLYACAGARRVIVRIDADEMVVIVDR